MFLLIAISPVIKLIQWGGRGLYKVISVPVGTASGIVHGTTRGLCSGGNVVKELIVHESDGIGMQLCKKLSNIFGDFFATGRLNLRELQVGEKVESGIVNKNLLDEVGDICSHTKPSAVALTVLGSIWGGFLGFTGVTSGINYMTEFTAAWRRMTTNPCDNPWVHLLGAISSFTRTAAILAIPFIGFGPGLVIASGAFLVSLGLIPVQHIMGGTTLLHQPEGYFWEPIPTWIRQSMGEREAIYR